MKIRLVSLAIAVGLFWGCQTQTVMIKSTRAVTPQPLDVKVHCDKCRTEIKFGPNPGDGGTNVQFGPGPGQRKDSRKRSYA